MSTITQVLVVERKVASVVTAGVQGPQGGEDVPYSKRVDFVGDTLIYRGEAAPGAATDAAVWRIRRFTIAGDGDVTEEWAAGSSSFNQVWDDRASLSYA